MILPALFHWSPADRRAVIRSEGLKPYCPPTISAGDDVAFPYLCFSPEPSAAWGLSGDMQWVSEIEKWDLWQVRLAEGDEVHYRNDFGPTLTEIRVYNAIPADRIWWVGMREPAYAEPITT